jgi:hypothetical protein
MSQNVSKNIIQSGVVGDTSYIKYNDGTMIQTLKTSGNTYAISAVNGPLFIGGMTWTFIATMPFYSAPVVVCSEYRWGNGSSWGSVAITPLTTEVSLRAFDIATRAVGTTTTISAIAVGRWRA